MIWYAVLCDHCWNVIHFWSPCAYYRVICGDPDNDSGPWQNVSCLWTYILPRLWTYIWRARASVCMCMRTSAIRKRQTACVLCWFFIWSGCAQPVRRPVLPTSASALFYTKVCFIYLRYAKLIVFIFSGMVWKRTSLTNSASMTPRTECEFKKKTTCA